MNTRLEEFKKKVFGANISVIGIGISNKPLIDMLVGFGAAVTARDKHTAGEIGSDIQHLQDLGVRLILGEDYLKDLSEDIIFKTPGMRYDIAELEAARANGQCVTSEMEVFFDVCPSHIVAVTGSDGKTTTTTLIHKMLTEQGYKTWLGGNIGMPLLSQADKMKKDDWVVLELSSFQLHTMRKSPEIAVITNISPNHLDVHKGYGEYIEAKKNIMLYQSEKDILVVNEDNDETREIGRKSRANTLYFSRKEHVNGAYLDGGSIYYNGGKILDISDIKVQGMHNVENYMAAICAVGHLVSGEAIRNVAERFGGVEHRIELVRTVGGVRYYNSSIDSSPNRTKNTLAVFSDKVILIAGGKDKGIPYDEIGKPIAERVKTLILIGMTADKIEKALNDEVKRSGNGKDINIIRVSTYQEAVDAARKSSCDGDAVVLSPASTSFDMFKNFEERGNLFKKLVNEIKE